MPYTEDGNKNYSLKRLWSKQKKILQAYASGAFSPKEIAAMYDVSVQTIYNIVNSALGKQTLELLDGAAEYDAVQLIARYKALAPIALAVQTDMLMGEDTSHALKNSIANKIQDRAGFAPPSKSIHLNADLGLSKEDILEIKHRALEIEQVVGEVEDV